MGLLGPREGVGLEVGVGHQHERVVEVRPSTRMLPVVGLDAEFDGVDAVLLPFEQVQRDGARAVGVELLGLLLFQLGGTFG
jgi:hypothetical protein